MRNTVLFISAVALLALVMIFGSSKKVSAPPEASFYGFIRDLRVEKKGIVIYIDKVEFLSGEEAIQKGMADTGCTRKNISDCIPSLNNDFYIRNVDTSVSPFVLENSTSISIMENPGSPALSSTTAIKFRENYPKTNLRLNQQPFFFLARDNSVIEATEQYTP